MAARAFAAMKISAATQTILFRGDGNVDKHTHLTHLLTHINSLSSKKAHKVHHRILAAQTVLAALGTAATPTCPTVSRFGQYTEIQFDDKHKIVGAKTLEFALDKARVTNVPPEERSFHVFYQLLAGASPEQRNEWRLNPDPAHWNYLASGSKAIEKADSDGFGKLLAALKTLGLSKKSQSHVLAVLAAILHLGQIQFVEAKNTETHDVETRVRNLDQVELVASLLGLDAAALESSLLQHTGYIGVDKCTVVHSVQQALEYTAKLASTLYALLFTWVTEFINSRLHFDNAHAMIAVAAFPGTQATWEPTPTHPSGSGVWAALANHVDAKVDKFSAEYIHALHAEFAIDANSPASLSLPVPSEPDTRTLRRRFAAELAERMPLDVLALFKSQCTNEFVAGLFALKAVADAAAAKSAHVPAKPLRKSSIKRKSKSGKSADEAAGPTILDELDGALKELLGDLTETNVMFVMCGHGHAAAQATLALAGPVLSSGGGLANYLVRAPLSRMVTRYGGLMTSRGLDEARPMRDRVDGLLRGIGVEDHVLGRESVWVGWKAVNMMERDLKKFKEWKKAQRGAGVDDATGSQYSAVAPGRGGGAGGAFDDGASYVSEDETYMSDNASMYDGFSIANGYSSTKGGAPGGAGASSAYGYSGLGSRSVMPDAASRAGAADQVEMLPAKDPTMPRVIEKKPTSPSRKRWVCFTWFVTWWIPSFCLSICGRMKDKHVQQAWREKVALCFIIFLLSCVVLFVIGVAGLIICPRKDVFSTGDLRDASSGKSRKMLAVVSGVVYDLNQLLVTLSPTFHSRAAFEPLIAADITAMFQRPPNVVCPGLNIDANIRFEEMNPNRTEANVGGYAASHIKDKWPRVAGILSSKQFRQGFYAVTEEDVREGWLWEDKLVQQFRFIVNNVVYDLTSYYGNQAQQMSDRKQDFLNFLPTDASPTQVSLPQYIKEQAVTGTVDFSNDERFMRIWNSPDKRIKECIQAMYTYAIVDDRNTWKCRYADYILLAMSIVLCCIILFKFLAALQLRGGTETPEKMDKFVMIQVPCYTEDELSMSRTINSIAALKYDDKRKLMIVIADGLIVGKGNDRPTSRIVLDILGVDPNLDPEPLSYQAIGEGTKQHNMAKVYSGLYEYEGHLVPYIVLVKVGKESETQRPGNRGKRDSQMMLMRFLNHLHYEKPMSPLELEMRHHITHVIGVDPKWYEYCLMIDADTTVHEESLTQLVAYSMTDTEIIGLCGETRLMNEKSTMTTMIQVYEYFISHHLSKSFESLFSSVTCLPGCFCMYRIVSANKGKPLLCHDTIIEEYSDIRVHTLHKKNLLHLGEDRYLTTLILKNFPAMKTKFTPAAIAYTFAPESFSVLLSQRRRWINSTFHNLFELIWVKGMCGFCCFSMRFIVFIDLIATIIQPATVLYLGYLIYLTVNAIVKEQSLNLVMISLILIAAMYGLQAIIFILKSAFDMIVWMIIYILAMPVFSFFIPLYSFWRFDDFSWGNTRVIVGDKGQKQLIREEDEYFDVSMIKHMKWDEYQAEVMETQSQASRMTDLERERELRELRELQLAAGGGAMSVRGGGSRPGSVHGPGGRPMSITSMQSLTQQQYMLAPAAAAGGFGGMPTDAELAHEIRRILMSSDLMRITKKQVREELSALFGMDLTPRKDFINGTIDAILRENM
ncbi:chitin synthase-domain-containing protein [Catenaria anguillulae PL171]|uniref:chitin synthase n=1 Tax=Catenaria anguillulae PL171 TaxID=765915 RepID=A0A1Y2I796_9FUNG|nr:chitin synthase-domain-containing protein [Catenaria anguillulae PL171]